MAEEFLVVFAIYPHVTQLDFTGPHEILARLPNAKCILASSTGGDLEADGGLVFKGVRKLAEIERCALICVPGGFGTIEAMEDRELLAQLRRLAKSARYVTSGWRVFSRNSRYAVRAASLISGESSRYAAQNRGVARDFTACRDRVPSLCPRPGPPEPQRRAYPEHPARPRTGGPTVPRPQARPDRPPGSLAAPFPYPGRAGSA